MEPVLHRHKSGFFQVEPMPNAAELDAYYSAKYFQNPTSSTYSVSYSSEELDLLKTRASLRRMNAESLLGTTHNRVLLDVGCGEGWVMGSFLDNGWRIVGIDYSEFGVLSQNPHLKEFLLVGDIYTILEDLIIGQETMNVINLAHVLEHVPDPVLLLTQLRKLLDPEGVLVVSVPNDGSPLHEELIATGRISRRWYVSPPDHLNYFTAQSLSVLAHDTGWGIADLWGDFPIDWFLANPHSNYVEEDARGPAAHEARLFLEGVISAADLESQIAFYRALAGVSLGRNLIAFMRPTASATSGTQLSD